MRENLTFVFQLRLEVGNPQFEKSQTVWKLTNAYFALQFIRCLQLKMNIWVELIFNYWFYSIVLTLCSLVALLKLFWGCVGRMATSWRLFIKWMVWYHPDRLEYLSKHKYDKKIAFPFPDYVIKLTSGFYLAYCLIFFMFW